MLNRIPEIVSATLPGLYVTSLSLSLSLDLDLNSLFFRSKIQWRFWVFLVRGIGLKDVCIHVLFPQRMEKFMERFDSWIICIDLDS